MNIQWLRTFLIAAKHENFREASERLFVSQPTVTFQIKQLEKELQTNLFKREGRNVSLTMEGKFFLKKARSILDLYDEGIADLRSAGQGFQSRIVLGASPFVASTHLPYILKRFIRQSPNVEVTVEVMESEEIEQALHSEKIDLGLTRKPPELIRTQSQILTEEPVILVVPPFDDFVSEFKEPQDFGSLCRELPILTHNHPVYWDELLIDLRQQFSFKTMKVSQVSATKRFIEEGLGMSFLPHPAVRRELAEGRLLQNQVSHIHLPRTKTFLISNNPSPPAENFKNFILALFR